ncbi:hypothetical protein [Eggerthella lenta]|uniref:hypothetical protein n=1 Tax=Eggerthella lenta TaxID=84112 RepID=UPI0036F3754E
MANLEGAAITREQFLLREMQVACGLREEGLSNEEIRLFGGFCGRDSGIGPAQRAKTTIWN